MIFQSLFQVALISTAGGQVFLAARATSLSGRVYSHDLVQHPAAATASAEKGVNRDVHQRHAGGITTAWSQTRAHGHWRRNCLFRDASVWNYNVDSHYQARYGLPL